VTEKNALRLIYGISAAVFLAVVVLSSLPKAAHMPDFVRYLPRFNATINALCSVLLVSSFICIKNGNVLAHKRLNITTFCLSSVFLLSYVTFHAFGVETRYPANHPWRPFYLAILISHIILAAAVLPLVLMSFYRALRGQIPEHRRLVRWTFPIWLYVTVSGVVVYLMISPYYQF